VFSRPNRFAASCRETADNLSRYLEHDLAFLRRRRVPRHLGQRIHCRALFHSLARTVEQLGTLGRSEPGLPSLADEIVKRIRGEAAPTGPS
jgi:predicted anti-sigma-YlaC factor YlaD